MERIVNVPPYCGAPSLSHQLPDTVVLVLVVVVKVVVVLLIVIDDVVDVDVEICVDVEVEVVLDVVLVQDARTIDVIMRQVNKIQTALFSI